MDEGTITVSLTLAQRELMLDAIFIWRDGELQMLSCDYTDEQSREYLTAADELEDLLGAVPAE